eukprot:5176710-Pleurochrysis_carterae.AAC.1
MRQRMPSTGALAEKVGLLHFCSACRALLSSVGLPPSLLPWLLLWLGTGGSGWVPTTQRDRMFTNAERTQARAPSLAN